MTFHKPEQLSMLHKCHALKNYVQKAAICPGDTLPALSSMWMTVRD